MLLGDPLVAAVGVEERDRLLDVASGARRQGGLDQVGRGLPARQAVLDLPDLTGDDLEGMLRCVGEVVLETLARDRASLRVAWRDLPAFPELSRRFVDRRLQEGFRQLGRWLRGLTARGIASVDDPEATAAVLLGSLAFFRLMDSVFEEPPGRLADQRLLDAWVALAVRALEVRSPG